MIWPICITWSLVKLVWCAPTAQRLSIALSSWADCILQPGKKKMAAKSPLRTDLELLAKLTSQNPLIPLPPTKKGPCTNYVDRILRLFDHPAPTFDTLGQKIEKCLLNTLVHFCYCFWLFVNVMLINFFKVIIFECFAQFAKRLTCDCSKVHFL